MANRTASGKLGGAAESKSDRLNQLALPNCHLVEAVLKQHYHVFNKDCRDRLKKLLNLILAVNTNIGKEKLDKINDNLKRKCLKNLRRRIQSLEMNSTSKKRFEYANRKKAVGGTLNSCGDHKDESKEMRILFKAKEKEAKKEVEATIMEAKECGDCKVVLEKENEQNTKLSDELSRIIAEYEHFFEHPKPPPSNLEYMLSRHKTRSSEVEHKHLVDRKLEVRQLRPLPKPKARRLVLVEQQSETTTTATTGTELDVLLKRYETELRRFNELVDECGEVKYFPDAPREVIARGENGGSLADVPALAVKYYVVLMIDMQRNCETYENFVKELVKPTESYKQPYIEAAYRCWMEYLSYVKQTLEHLQPYIKNLIFMCKKRHSGDPDMLRLERRLPKVLVNGMKNMKPWRRALAETVDCCRDLINEDLKQNGVSLNIHKMYVRYHQKIGGLTASNVCDRSPACSLK